ncbi:MAG TPA: hypothetical protein VMF59_12190, partial [Bacteroidota bacterium]|nr:hypothetical protein [Bacteroidota bacterium]
MLATMTGIPSHTILLAALLLGAPLCFCQGAAIPAEQFVVVNIIPGEAYAPIFAEVAHLAEGRTHEHPPLGIGAIFSYLNDSHERVREAMDEFLSLSEKYDIPVVVQLDGEQWWGARPDLWNWWDPDRPGYDTANRMNVEWFGWGPQYA